ncbi:eukaryotic type KH-domain (KH-domain type I) [Trametes coccinea BRFM310]|uniref:Eukaryotic type KH-domain (KH-domain type I) n=1 Tax=Trametes coccinea (strain BRFM310) TaxID=1353009 RepID=A0A1Y2J7E1_TRAC3|nr:eukaryotic type KH-domain (KH-domain type I) [Trametes coccinea BRFM310]
MSATKRKWDQAAPDQPESDAPSAKATKVEDGKSASEAAAAAAAIAAKIAAQFANSSGSPAPRDPHDGEFTHDIDINDVRNRYLLTKGATQQQIHEETGASVSTKGVWYPDRSKATEKDPPLYLHVTATSKEMLDKAVGKIHDLMNTDIGPLVEDKSSRVRERRKWPEEKIPIGLESIRNFNVRAKVVGPQGMFVKYIQQETGTRVQIKGQGSGFVDQETGHEHDEPMFIHVTGPDEQQVQRAKALTEDLLEVVRAEHAKMKTLLQQQQMELHQAQVQYAAYSAYGGYAPPQPGSAPPPPPPGEQPPPPPDGSAPAPPAGAPTAGQAGAAPAATDMDAYAAYWAAYGYDVNSPQFKEWQAQQAQQYAQYYAQAGYTAGATGTTPTPSAPGSAPPPSDPAPPPPPPA